jgi:glc operon protein GlcG
MVRAACAALVLVACSAPLHAQQAVTHHSVSVEQAQTMLRAAYETAKQRKDQVAIVVVDDHGDVIASLRMDGAKAFVYELARRKAVTSADWGSPSKNFQDALDKGRTGLLAMDRVIPLAGGLPVKLGDETIGAIATSGGSGADGDTVISQAGLDALK